MELLSRDTWCTCIWAFAWQKYTVFGCFKTLGRHYSHFTHQKYPEKGKRQYGMNLLHVEITHLLSVHATCYNFRFQQGNTPLHLAALGNQSEVTKILIKKKCQVDIQNYVSVLSKSLQKHLLNWNIFISKMLENCLFIQFFKR